MALYSSAAPSGLLNAAANYPHPMTSGLLGALGNATNNGVPNYSAIAYQNAGSPHYGPYAQTSPPSGVGIPGAVGQGSQGSSIGQTIGGLLGGIAQDPSLVKNIGGLLGNLFGNNQLTPITPAGQILPESPAGITVGSLPPAASGPAPGGTVSVGQPTTTSFGAPSSSPTPPTPQMTSMPFDAAAATAGALPALAAALPSAAPAGTVTVGPLIQGAASAFGSAAPAAAASDALTPIVPTASYLSAPAAAAPSAASAGMGALGGGLLAGGLALAPVLAGMLTPAVTENAQYYSTLANNLSKGNTSPTSPFIPDQQELAGMIMRGDPTPYTQAQLNAWGIPQVIAGLNQASQNPLSGFANQTVSNRAPVRLF